MGQLAARREQAAGAPMGKSHKRPDWSDAERAVKVICQIVNEAIKLYMTLRGLR
jgi:hypothetical protein